MSIDFPWRMISVLEAIERRRGKEVRKLQTSEYAPAGALPIVDQGADLICGYTDDLQLAYPHELPVIVFGDHTRALKFVDFPFAIGADGTQCLHPVKGFDARFFFYALAALDLRSEGYARHFKLLKEQRIPFPSLDEQRRIAEVLLSVDEAIAATQATLSFCENFLIDQRRETFLHLIDETGETSMAFSDMCDLGRGFAFKSEDYQTTGVLNFRVTNVGKPVDDLGGKCFLPEAFMDTYDEYVLWGDEIVLVMVGATVGKLGRVPEEICPALLNQNMWTLNAKAPFTRDLLWHLAHVLIEAKVHGAQGGAYSFLTKKDFLRHRVGSFDHLKMAERVSYLSAIEAYIQRLVMELRAAIAMKAALSTDLLSGHVRVPT